MKKLFAVAFLALILCSCAETACNIKSNTMVSGSVDKSVVFGKILLRGMNDPIKTAILFGKRREDGKSVKIVATEGTSVKNSRLQTFDSEIYFFIELPKGKYKFDEIEVGIWSTDVPFIFEVPENNTIYYVGTIEWLDTGPQTLDKHGQECRIVNDYVTASEVFRQRYPDMKGEIQVQKPEFNKESGEDWEERRPNWL